MEYIKHEGLVEALYDAGIRSGDTILIHSDISTFGIVENFSRKKQLEVFYNAIREVLGNDEGTLCVPAFFYEYARFGEPFDIDLSPVSKSLGVFSSYVASLPESYRSCNPPTSIAAVGKNAEYICRIDNCHSYGEDSPWHKMHKLKGKIVLLGTENGLTFSHYVDYRVGLPQLYTKIYDVPVYKSGKKILDYTFASVRYLKYNINWITGSRKLQKELLIEKGVMTYSHYLSGQILVIDMEKMFDYYKNILYKNPYYFLANKPEFVYGEVPYDGPVLKDTHKDI